jgi:hypothetical protein
MERVSYLMTRSICVVILLYDALDKCFKDSR